MIEAAGAMAYVMVDVESDGPIPGDYSMICVGAVLVQEGLGETFYGRLRPISEQWIPEALAVSGFSRAETLSFDDPKTVMEGSHTGSPRPSRAAPCLSATTTVSILPS
jgi:hypothetical protein